MGAILLIIIGIVVGGWAAKANTIAESQSVGGFSSAVLGAPVGSTLARSNQQ